MSLIRVRRDRKRLGGGGKKPPSLFRLLFLLAMVAGLIWFLSRIG